MPEMCGISWRQLVIYAMKNVDQINNMDCATPSRKRVTLVIISNFEFGINEKPWKQCKNFLSTREYFPPQHVLPLLFEECPVTQKGDGPSAMVVKGGHYCGHAFHSPFCLSRHYVIMRDLMRLLLLLISQLQ